MLIAAYIAAYIAAGLTFVAIMLAINRSLVGDALMQPNASDIRFRIGFVFAIGMLTIAWPLALLFVSIKPLLESRR